MNPFTRTPWWPSAAAVLSLAISSTPVAQLHFVDVAPATGTTLPSYGRGSAMVDLDGDGRLDLVAGNTGMANAFFRQREDGTFQRMNGAWDVPNTSDRTWGILAADFDNDGDDDVYIVNGGFDVNGTPHAPVPNVYLRNDLSTLGRFTDRTGASGAAGDPAQEFGGTVLDYDRDGDLDIFLSTTDAGSGCRLLRNNGNARFVDVSVAAGVAQPARHRHVSMGDVNNDGWPDVAVGGWAENLLYLNNGDGTFTDVADDWGIRSPSQNFGLDLDDFNNDGWLDAFVPKYRLTGINSPSELYLNNRRGAFVDVTPGSGMTAQLDMGHTTGDFDSDGYPDIYVGSGNPDAADLDKMYLVRPIGLTRLVATDVTEQAGLTTLGPNRCHGMAFGDYDEDGDVDIYVNNGGPESNTQWLEINALWQNDGNARNWIQVELTGRISNRNGVGARVVAIGTDGKRVYRTRRIGHGFLNTNSPRMHLGMDQSPAVHQIVIQWPSGIRQRVRAPESRKLHRIAETGVRVGGTASPGSVVTFELAGSAGHGARVLFGSATTPTPLPGVSGLFELAAPIHMLPEVVLDERGTGSVAVPLPQDPSLVGQSRRIQAWLRPLDRHAGGELTEALTVTVVP